MENIHKLKIDHGINKILQRSYSDIFQKSKKKLSRDAVKLQYHSLNLITISVDDRYYQRWLSDSSSSSPSESSRRY